MSIFKIQWHLVWQHTPVFLPREYPGQRSLVGYSPQGRKEPDMTERLHLLTSYVYASLQSLPLSGFNTFPAFQSKSCAD